MTESLPSVRGRLKANAPLGARSWFRTGGAADWLFTPADHEDLINFLRHRPASLSLTVLGACSNVIIRDGGVEGVVIRLAGGFAEMERDGDGLIVGAAALDMTVAEYAAQQGLGGMAFLAGIPGSIGGAVCMNAGAYNGDMQGILDWVDILKPDGTSKRLAVSELPMRYRHGGLPEGAIVLRARLKGMPEESNVIHERIAAIRAAREASQPLRTRTGGSTFRNPDGHKAWTLIDAAGCRGLRHGDALVSEKHCNFLLNLGHATSIELEELGDMVRQRVKAHSGITLQWEIKRLGRYAA